MRYWFWVGHAVCRCRRTPIEPTYIGPESFLLVPSFFFTVLDYYIYVCKYSCTDIHICVFYLTFIIDIGSSFYSFDVPAETHVKRIKPGKGTFCDTRARGPLYSIAF